MKTIAKLKKPCFTLIILIGISCFTACDSDNYKELSGNYIFRDEGVNNKCILSNDVGSPDIYSKVVSYNFNSNFIVAKQEPIYKNYVEMMGFKLRTTDSKKYSTNSIKEQKQSEAEADSLLKYNPYYQSIFINKVNYWIISHKEKKLYGPLTESEYTKTRCKLRVPEKLSLEP